MTLRAHRARSLNLKKRPGTRNSWSGGIFRSIRKTFFLQHGWASVPQNPKHHIPQGHIPNMIPNFTGIAKRLIIERDTLRSTSSSDPHIKELNPQVHHNIKISNRLQIQCLCQIFSYPVQISLKSEHRLNKEIQM